MWRLIRHFENNLKFFGVDKMRQMPIKAVINEKLNSWSGIIRQAGSVIFPNVYMQKRSNTPTEFDSDVKDNQFPRHSSRNDSKCLDNGKYNGENFSIPFDTKLLEVRELAPYKSNKTQRKMLENNNVSNDMHIPSTSNVAPPVLGENTVLNKGVFEKRIFDVNPEKMNKQQSLCVGGRFQNPWTTWKALTFTNALKFVFSKNESEVPSKENLDSILPIFKQEYSRMQSPNNALRVTWMGHSTVLVQMHGLNILTDPMFSDRASPSQAFGPKRYRSPPCSIHDLPHINAVVISHNHYDHLDLSTVTSLNERFGAKTHWFVPLGLQSWMQQAGCENVVEMDWWEESCIPDHGDILFIFTPAQHWSKRSLTDDNKVLWGSWSILGSKFRFFFAGDTGYCNAFKQIGNFYGPFDLSAIPMGAYEPRWFMKYAHVNPKEAVRMHLDIRSKCSLGIHWGTFCLGTEHYLDPLLKLQESLDHHKIPRESFFTLRHGESRLIGQ